MTGSEVFLCFTDIGTLQVANLCSHLVQGGANDSQGGQEVRMTIALNNLSSQTYRLQVQLLAYILFNKRINIGISTNSAGQLAHCHHLTSLLQALHIALDFVGPQQEFHAKGHGLCMNTMGTTNHYSVLEFSSTATQNAVEVFQMTHD